MNFTKSIFVETCVLACLCNAYYIMDHMATEFTIIQKADKHTSKQCVLELVHTIQYFSLVQLHRNNCCTSATNMY